MNLDQTIEMLAWPEKPVLKLGTNLKTIAIAEPMKDTTVSVYHNPGFLSRINWETVTDKELVIAFQHSKMVAVVTTDDLDEAFMLTNHIDRPWTENLYVRAYGDRNRSTSSGDFMVRNGVIYLVDFIGFRRITI